MSTSVMADRRYEQLLERLKMKWNSESQRAYLTDRYGERLHHAYRAHRGNRRLYTTGRWIVVGFASVSPALVALATQTQGRAAGYLKAGAIVVTALVAIATAALTALRADAYWRVYHRLRSDLEAVGWKAAAVGEGSGYATFVFEVEKHLKEFETTYQEEVATQQI